MTISELCAGLGVQEEVREAVVNYEKQLDYDAMSEDIKKLQSRHMWDEGIRNLQELCGPDEGGLKMLTVCMHCLLTTYEGYKEHNIPEPVFWETMKFIPRFLQSFYDTNGVYVFIWAWWMPRQISMNEFRIGEYEYEFVDDNDKKSISIHIPSDAKLAEGNIEAIYDFVKEYYPEYSDAEIYCDSWLLAPTLKELLPKESNIVRFQEQFEIINADEDSPNFMDWLYPRRGIPYEDLPEGTSLQRNVKKYLLGGGKIGTAYGRYFNKNRLTLPH